MAEDDDNSQKTEEPTGKRLQTVREQGQVPVSRELNHWFIIAGATLVLFAFAPGIAHSLTNTLRGFIAKPHEVSDDITSLTSVLSYAITKSALAIVLPLLILMVAGLAASILQTGFLFSIEPIIPKLSKLSPIEGFKRIFSFRSIIELAKSIAKFIIVGTVAYEMLRPALPNVEHFITLEPGDVLIEIRHLILRLAFGILVAMTLIMIADIIYQRLSFNARMRMTKQEVKEEMKQNEGDPIIKARLRQIRLQRARRRMMANVPKADVVVTNPTHYAIALQYDPEAMTAPLVLAKGQDLIARKIRELAKENDITIVENPPLARALYASVEVDQEVPPEHYKAVAEVISFVFKLRGRRVVN